MNRNVIGPILAAQLFYATSATGANIAPTDATPEERQKALDYIEKTNQGLLDAVRGLSAAQWNFKPAPDRWSVAEVLEHIALIEDVVIGILQKLPEAAPAPEGRDVARIDAEIFAKLADRTEKAKAPPVALPSGRWTPDAALAHFGETNRKIRTVLETTHDLRSHVINHPLFGPWDGYQWIIGVTGHTDRHTRQILEVKADPGFPAK
jgi:uncharacterized damage-inducible protein DinB